MCFSISLFVNEPNKCYAGIMHIVEFVSHLRTAFLGVHSSETGSRKEDPALKLPQTTCSSRRPEANACTASHATDHALLLFPNRISSSCIGIPVDLSGSRFF